MNFLTYLFISFLFLALWWLVRKWNSWLKTRGYFRNKNLLPLLTVLLLIIWSYFSMWFFLSGNSIYPSALLVLSLTIILPLAIYFGQDVIAGLIFQINGKVSKGAQLNTVTGIAQVIKVGYNAVLISDEKNEIKKVYYSDLQIIESNMDEGAFQDENLISIDLSIVETDEKQIIKSLNRLIYSSPLVKTGITPSISIKTKKGKSEVKVTLELISNSYQERFKTYLKDNFLI